jgi:hypothetical protein
MVSLSKSFKVGENVVEIYCERSCNLVEVSEIRVEQFSVELLVPLQFKQLITSLSLLSKSVILAIMVVLA